MAKRYTRVNWKSGEEGATPLSAENLNQMDKGIADNAVALAGFQKTQNEINEALKARNLELERSLEAALERLDGAADLDTIPDAPEEAKEPAE